MFEGLLEEFFDFGETDSRGDEPDVGGAGVGEDFVGEASRDSGDFEGGAGAEGGFVFGVVGFRGGVWTCSGDAGFAFDDGDEGVPGVEAGVEVF